jgi:hypothetical protein
VARRPSSPRDRPPDRVSVVAHLAPISGVGQDAADLVHQALLPSEPLVEPLPVHQSSTGSWQLTRHPEDVGPARNSPPSAVARSCMPINP